MTLFITFLANVVDNSDIFILDGLNLSPFTTSLYTSSSMPVAYYLSI